MAGGNVLYYGDNLDVLRQHIADESIDLVYLDPPFNSNATYNVLFAEQDGSRAASQIEAFTDTWRWDQAAVADYERTAARYVKRPDFPGPLARLAAGPVWHRVDVDKWAKKHLPLPRGGSHGRNG
jgi:hypothetical protein